MLSAIIIEDEKLAREVLTSMLDKYFEGRVHILGDASSMKQGVSLINKFHPQLVFLDIELKGNNGFELFNHFESPRNFEVVFTTAYKDFAIKAIRNGAFDYLLKPISVTDLSEMLQRLEQHFENLKGKKEKEEISIDLSNDDLKWKNKLPISMQQGYHFEDKENIIYCEGMINYSKLYLASGKVKVVSKTLKSLHVVLGEPFYRIHKSYLVNLNHVMKYSRTDGFKITLSNQTVLDVSYRNKEKFIQVFFENR